MENKNTSIELFSETTLAENDLHKTLHSGLLQNMIDNDEIIEWNDDDDDPHSCDEHDSDSQGTNLTSAGFSESNNPENPLPTYLDINNLLMFPQSGLNVNEVVEMLSGFFIQFGLTENARIKLFEIIKILAGPNFQNLNISNYLLNQMIDPPESKIIYHFYCQACESQIVYSSVKSKIKNSKQICEKCEAVNIISLDNSKYFLSIDFQYQMQLLLKDKTISECIFKEVTGNCRQNNDRNIKDIHDSRLYRHTEIDFPCTISYNMSTDGAPLAGGIKAVRSFWPLTIVLNDLPPEIRFKNILLVGMMVVDKEPHPDLMNLFIDKFKVQAVHLHEDGIPLTFLKENCTQIVTFTPHCVIADTPARALLQNKMRHNGYCSCGYCYQLGFHHNIVKFHSFIGSDCEQRTHHSHMKDVLEAKKKVRL